jgi:hypothetical protein
MFLRHSSHRIARSLVTILALGVLQTGLSTPAAQANIPVKPTITSITSGATSLTVNMVTSGITATQWRWSITRRVTSGCTNSLGDGVVQSTGSLSSTISITGLTAGCVYSVSVAGFNGVIGEYAESSKLVGGYTNGLLAYHINEAGASSVMTRRPFTTGTCGIEVVANLSREYLLTGPTGCNVDGFTSYYLGYIRAPITGVVTFKSRSDDGSILNIQGNNVFSDLTDHGPAVANSFNASGTVSMVAGEIYRIEYWHHEKDVGATNILDWEYSGRTQIAVPTESLATDPSVFAGTCPLGLAERCAAGSAYEIKLATNTNMDGMYWIMVNGTPTLTYSIMNSAFHGGGWMLAMKGKKSASDFDYGDALWTNTTTLNPTYPERWKNGDTNRDIDAKYGVFGFNKTNQIMAIFPEQTTYAGGAVAAATQSPINSTAYGFNWIETTTAMRPWAAYNASAANGNPAGWGGNSWNVAISGGPTATPSCVNSATTLTNLFTSANRCAFRQVQATYNASEVPYSAIGNGLFYSQTQIRFFGVNYGSSGGNRDRARFGFGWNENNPGDEGSSDGTSGIGIDRQGYSSITTGSINQCCATQNGISGAAISSTNIPFEMYIRNSSTASFTGNNLRITFLRQSSLTAGNGFTVSGTNGTNTFRMSQIREGISINPSNGVLTVSEALSVGTYQETVTVTDTDGVTGFRAVTIQVLADSSETDTALTFAGTANLTTSGTFTLTGDQTWEAWVKPTSACSGTQKTVFGSDAFVMLCISDYWYISFRNAAGAWASFQASQRINYDSWTHLAVVRSGTTASFYINNAQVRVWGGSAWDLTWQVPNLWATASPIYVGGWSGTQYYSGDVDELTIWTEARTLTQITDGMYVAPNLGSTNLFGYWDFNEGPGSTLSVSRSQISDTRYNFTPLSTQWVSVATTTTSGPYTVVRIPRTLITKAGGWRVPDSITAVSVLLVGGGGGGSAVFMTRPADPGGAGGGGGVYFAGSVPVTPASLISLRVGAGGAGGTPTDDRASVRGYSGATTTFSALSAGGGGAGGYFDTTNQDGLPGTAGGAGGGASNFWSAYDSGSPGLSSSATIDGRTFPASATAGSGAIFNGTAGYAGGGAGGSGSATARGAGIPSSITGETVTYGVGGGSNGVTGWSFSQLSSFGNGGDAVYNWNIGGAQGGSGLIVIRYITALKPVFTQPTNTTINVGMTETFTVNVAADSTTVGLTRTFRWESSTTGAGGTFTTIKQGTGANNAFFSWVPTDTSTTGSNFRFRVVVTDSDTAGLFIQETSTSVFATINRTLTMTGRSTISKSIGVSRSETFTVGDGTPAYRYTLTPDSAFFWLDTVTASTPRLRIADTATVGTYLETITVIDSVSASVTIPLTITISPPPSFSANAEQVDSGTVLYLDAGNSASYPRTGTSWSDLSGRGLSGNLTANLGSKLTASSINTCTAPNFSTDGNGSLVFESARNTCAYVANLGTLTSYTVDTWIKRSGSQSPYSSIIATPYAANGRQVNIALHWLTATDLIAGVYTGSGWIYSSQVFIPDNTWVNAVATFSGSRLTLIVNNVASTESGPINITWDSAKLDTGVVLGRKWDGDTNWMSTSVASLRIYNRVLTTAELTQNYNATRGKFEGTSNKIRVTGKYGTTVNETFTVTAGSETLTAAFTSNAITGLRWDTSTVRSLKVQLQESLTAGTYLDTVTVTDIYGTSSRIPLTFVVSKADTLTVIIDTPTALSYTGTIANFTPTVRVTGLVSSDTGTAVSTINYKPGGLTCATGGTCVVGDIGPGGGIVFITPSTVGGNGRFFEVAPANWAGVDDVSTAGKFCIGSTNQDAIDRPGTQSGIGWGETNTTIFEAHCTGGAVKLVGDYAGGGFTNWFIPSSSELTELAKVRNSAGLLRLNTTWSSGRFGYWGSTQSSATVMATLVTVNNVWSVGGTSKADSANNMVRPVRMFTPCWAVDTCTSLSTTTKPTDAGTYSITPDGLLLTQGNLSNYESIQYRVSTVTINRISQTTMQIPTYNLIYPDTMTVEVRGGNGTGASVFSVQSGGTASGCTFDYRKLYTTSAGTCSIQIVKAGDRNYLPETATASILFIQFVFTQATPTVGSGPNIALNGENDVTVDVDLAPMISSLSLYEATAGVTSITIYGVGFNNSDASFEVKFWRGVNGTGFTVNPAKTEITVTVPAGTRTGKVIVVTSKGLAQSELPLTITP